MNCGEDPLSDDEIFFGKLTLKEFKKHILWKPSGNPNSDYNTTKNDINSSIKIIETHSEPNLRDPINKQSHNYNNSPPSSTMRASDESFLKIENMVSKLSLTPRTSDNIELNNTLEVIDYILNNGSKQQKNEEITKSNDMHIDSSSAITQEKTTNIAESTKTIELEVPKQKEDPPLPEASNSEQEENNMHIASTSKLDPQESPKFYTPMKSDHRLPTPSSNMKMKTPTFKTPAYPLSGKKPSATSLKKTPGRSNAYQHITSPVASYIKNCPQVPLVKDIQPRKPLPGLSAIPKYIKNPIHKTQNKENMNLPSVAYKSAKKTKVINLPEEDKLPQCQWAKQLASTLPRPMVMKHENREMNIHKKTLLSKHEDSFANLTCCQAEVSVCTQKTAFKSHNKH